MCGVFLSSGVLRVGAMRAPSPFLCPSTLRFWECFSCGGRPPTPPHVFARPPTLFRSAISHRHTEGRNAFAGNVHPSFFGIIWRPLHERRARLVYGKIALWRRSAERCVAFASSKVRDGHSAGSAGEFPPPQRGKQPSPPRAAGFEENAGGQRSPVGRVGGSETDNRPLGIFDALQYERFRIVGAGL